MGPRGTVTTNNPTPFDGRFAGIGGQIFMTTFVLVHGGMHDAWCWNRIIGPLSDFHAVEAVHLPGRGGVGRPGPVCKIELPFHMGWTPHGHWMDFR